MTMLAEPVRPVPPDRAGRPTACVVGGGIAGVAAAVRLAETGWRVTLLEARTYLGGRATSHTDPRTGQPLDNCQHVLLRCCTALIGLFEKLGVADQVEWHDRLHFLDDGGRHGVICAAPLPSPAHLAPSLLRCRFLSTGAKLAVARGMLALRRKSVIPDDLTFAQWLRLHAQPEEAVSRFWSVVAVSALNETNDRASAAMAAKVFRDSFLGARDAFHVGVPRVPLAALYRQVGELLQRQRGGLRVGVRVRCVNVDLDRVTGVACADGSIVRADTYVCALPPERLGAIIPTEVTSVDSRFVGLRRLEYSPIVAIHLWFDRRVLPYPYAALLGCPLHWLFDRGTAPSGMQHVQGVTSAAREWIDLPRDQIVRRVVDELHRYLPASAGARLVRAEVYKERRATFSVTAGAESLRPQATGAVGNLYLAGDYCRTGWPATMEGAARSGFAAADAAIASRKAVRA